VSGDEFCKPKASRWCGATEGATPLKVCGCGTSSGDGTTTSSLPGALPSAEGFDRSEWEIMYPLIVKSGLVAPPERGDD
jgi:hypothetical protein